jgi:hypothetical protein
LVARTSERRAVRLGRVDEVRRAVGDVRAYDHHRRLSLLGLGAFDCLVERGQVVGIVDPLHVPALSFEAAADVVGVERDRGGSVDCDVVVVVEEDQLAEAELAGDRCGLAGDSLHQVAVGADDVDVVVDDLVPGAVEAVGEEALGDGEADGIGEARAERTGGRFDARGDEVLGVPGGARLPLAELLQVVEAEVVAAEMQGRVLQDAGVPGREDEAVAVRPVGIGGVVPQVLRVEQIGQRCQSHGRAGMTRIGLLYGVHRQRAKGEDRLLAYVPFGHFAPTIADYPVAKRYASGRRRGPVSAEHAADHSFDRASQLSKSFR